MMASGGRDRSRSPRTETHHHPPGAFPLADFLFDKGILDERSVAFLKKSPRKFAEEVLLSLGPEVRNPSAFVTRKLQPTLRGPGDVAGPEPPLAMPQQGGASRAFLPPWANMAAPAEADILWVHCNGASRPLPWRSQEEAVQELLGWGVLDEGSADFLAKAPEREAKEIVASIGPEVRNPAAFVTRKLKDLHLDLAAPQQGEPQGQARCEHILVHFNGAPLPLVWFSKEQAIENLMTWGVLDESSADFLMRAPEHEAKQIVQSLGPDVRNPSAFVTRKMRELVRDASFGNEMGPQAFVDVIPIAHNGMQLSLPWHSKEQALGDLVRAGVLDEGSADFLMKAPDQEAKEIISCLGPDIKNPSAFVTRKMKDLRGGGAQLDADGTQKLVIHHNGYPMTLEWTTAEQVIWQLASKGVLDDGSAEFLGKVPDDIAKDIITKLGPEIKNPSAFVTRMVKAALQSEAPPPKGPLDASIQPIPGGPQESRAVVVYHNGNRVTVPWHSKDQVLDELVKRAVLDQRSADFVAKIPDKNAYDIISSLGPDVRNPSAFVTKESRKWQP